VPRRVVGRQDRQRERRRELPADEADVIDRHPLARHPRRQALAFDVLHHDERASVLLEHVVHGGDVGMVQTGDRARLAQHTRVVARRARCRGRQAL